MGIKHSKEVEKQRKHEKREKRWLRHLSADLRAGTIDDLVAAYATRAYGARIRRIRKPVYGVDVSSLKRYVQDHRCGFVRFLASSVKGIAKWFTGRIPQETQHANSEILKILCELKLEEQFFAYASRFIVFSPGKIARACELLHFFKSEPSGNLVSWFEDVHRSEDEYNLFRLAQRIRDEHGAKRGLSDGFRSYEDVVLWERKVAHGEVANFLMQCMMSDGATADNVLANMT